MPDCNILPLQDDKEGWRQKFLVYYATNAPEKAAMVTDAMMQKWLGKYEKLLTGMCGKYGEPGHPIAAKPKPKPKPKRRGSGAGGKLSLDDCRQDFEALKQQQLLLEPPQERMPRMRPLWMLRR